MEDSSCFGNLSELEILDDLFCSHEAWPQNSLLLDQDPPSSLPISCMTTAFCDGDMYSNHSLLSSSPHYKQSTQSALPIKGSTWNSSSYKAVDRNQMMFDDSRACSYSSFRILDPNNYSDINPSGTLDHRLKPKEEAHEQSSCFMSSVLNFDQYSEHSVVSQSSLGNKRIRNNSTRVSNVHAQDHILAERKRRERLNQRIIALSALLPGLKKMDKASVLGDAIKYMKQLQERVKILEEGGTNYQDEKKPLIGDKSAAHRSSCSSTTTAAEDHSSSSDDGFSTGIPITSSEQLLPEIKVRFRNKDVLISIHCQKRNHVLQKTVAEIENLHLSVVNSSVMPFGDSSLSITIIAQKDDEAESDMNMKEVVNYLFHALKASII